MRIDTRTWHEYRFANLFQSLLILAAMAALLSTLGWVIAGATGLVCALAGGTLLAVLIPPVSPSLILRMHRARPLRRHEAPYLHALLAELAERAELPMAPTLARIPSSTLNAFAVGTRESAAIAVTDGLLRFLGRRELAGVLAHEVSHIRHNDMWVLGLASLFGQLTAFLSSAGQILLIVTLPVVLFGANLHVSWTAIALLIVAPTLSVLMQLALSRTREFDADLGATLLTGDPKGLAAALSRMEHQQRRSFGFGLFRSHPNAEEGVLRSHPPTEERIRRLLASRVHDRKDGSKQSTTA